MVKEVKVMLRNIMNRFEVDAKLCSFEKEF